MNRGVVIFYEVTVLLMFGFDHDSEKNENIFKFKLNEFYILCYYALVSTAWKYSDDTMYLF
jgi:hypothetical protein